MKWDMTVARLRGCGACIPPMRLTWTAFAVYSPASFLGKRVPGTPLLLPELWAMGDYRDNNPANAPKREI